VPFVKGANRDVILYGQHNPVRTYNIATSLIQEQGDVAVPYGFHVYDCFSVVLNGGQAVDGIVNGKVQGGIPQVLTVTVPNFFAHQKHRISCSPQSAISNTQHCIEGVND